jgi:hypothetical protein
VIPGKENAMSEHRFAYPTVREIPPTTSPEDGARRYVRPSQRELVLASLVRRPDTSHGR